MQKKRQIKREEHTYARKSARDSHLVTQSDSSFSEGLPLLLEAPPLPVKLLPVVLQPLPLLQIVAVHQLSGEGRSHTVLREREHFQLLS